MPRFHNTQKKLPTLKNIKAFEKELDLNLEEVKPKPEFVCDAFDYFLKNIQDSPE